MSIRKLLKEFLTTGITAHKGSLELQSLMRERMNQEIDWNNFLAESHKAKHRIKIHELETKMANDSLTPTEEGELSFSRFVLKLANERL